MSGFMWKDLFTAIALLLVLEGMMPFLKPHKWRKVMSNIVDKPDSAIRNFGFGSMIIGVLLLYFIR